MDILKSHFRRLLAATAVSDTANGVFALAAGIVAASSTRSTLVVAMVMIAASLPWLVAAAPAGAVVDRWGPVRSITWANLGRAVCMSLTALLVYWEVALAALIPVMVFVVATLQTVVDSAAEVATVDLVESDRLTRANGFLHVTTRLFYQFLGPALAGLLIDVRPVLPFAVSGLACLLSVGLVSGLPRVASSSTDSESPSGMWEGVRLVLSRPVLASLVAVGGLTTIANGAFYTVLIVYAVSPGPLGLSASEYGLLIGATGVGAACGALTTHWFEGRVGRSAVLLLTRVGWAIVFAAPLAGNRLVLMGAMFAGSFFGGMWSVESLSIRQRLVSRDLLGRVSGASRMLTYGMTPVGALLGGAVGLGVPPPYVFLGCMATALLAIIPIRLHLSERAIAAAASAQVPAR